MKEVTETKTQKLYETLLKVLMGPIHSCFVTRMQKKLNEDNVDGSYSTHRKKTMNAYNMLDDGIGPSEGRRCGPVGGKIWRVNYGVVRQGHELDCLRLRSGGRLL
jgi:hypothetical protein